jgi:hypothetical protein
MHDNLYLYFVFSGQNGGSLSFINPLNFFEVRTIPVGSAAIARVLASGPSLLWEGDVNDHPPDRSRYQLRRIILDWVGLLFYTDAEPLPYRNLGLGGMRGEDYCPDFLSPAE